MLARSTTLRAVILFVTAILCALLVSDWQWVPSETIRAGEVAPRTVSAPFPFSYVDAAADADARRRAREAALPVFLHDEALVTELSNRVGTAFRQARAASEPVVTEGEVEPTPLGADARRAILQGFLDGLGVRVSEGEAAPLAEAGFPKAAEAMILTWVEGAYDDVYVVGDRSVLPEDGRPLTVLPRVGDREAFELSVYERIVVPEDVRAEITLAALREKRGEPWVDAAAAVALSLVQPDLVFDAGRSAAAAESAAEAVSVEPVVVQRGETLFREGDRVNAVQAMRYDALQSARSDDGVWIGLGTTAAFFLLLLGTLYLAGRAAFDEEEGTRDLAALTGTLVVVTLIGRVVVSMSGGLARLAGDVPPESAWYLVPVAGGAILTRTLMGTRRGAMYALAASAMVAVLMDLNARFLLYFLLTSLVATTVVPRHLRERKHVLQGGLITGLFGAALAVVLHLVDLYVGQGELSAATRIRPFVGAVFALMGGLFSGLIVLAVMPLFEGLGFTTTHRMLELASINHPLLRQLSLKAPGTYHHSVVVGNLAEAACEAIGANGLEARISALFHDIGKARDPRYFVENQRGGVNPHGQLAPTTSAEVIIRHVTEGARMAREHKLPRPILDNILMHHGTGLLQYFFAKAQMEADNPAQVEETAFRYPGPKPNTREAGVIMIADKVEAATRTIRQPNEDNIRAMINRIINSVIADHQFTECPLTFQEIHTIADTFTSVLMGIYHERIEYPQTADVSRQGEPGQIAGQVGTITLELESRRMVEDDGDLWNDDAELTDETTDYESVRNLPHGEY